jgi:FtsP/CotA-like multicopper oxidase with cupredoxin domain
MEVDAYYDGVAGWSGAGSRNAPLIAPGDSFVVAFTPPRAGTFMYHTHMEEERQMNMGLFGPMIVVEPGERFEPESDLIFMIGEVNSTGSDAETINGMREIAPRTLRVGRTYRLRLLDIHPDGAHEIILRRDSTALMWIPVAKDGADLPALHRSPREARFAIAVGETYDFLWTPAVSMNAQLTVRRLGKQQLLVVPIQVR